MENIDADDKTTESPDNITEFESEEEDVTNAADNTAESPDNIAESESDDEYATNEYTNTIESSESLDNITDSEEEEVAVDATNAAEETAIVS